MASIIFNMAGGKPLGRMSKRKPAPNEQQAQDPLSAVCPITGLTNREKNLLQVSWKHLLAKGQRDFASRLLVWMFTNIDGMHDMFSRFKNESLSKLESSENFVAHGEAITITLGTMMNLLDQPVKLEKKMDEILKMHNTRKNTPADIMYFKQLRDKFHTFVQQERQLSESDPEVVAWNKFFTLMVETGEKGAKKSLDGSSGSHFRGKGCCILL